MSPTMTSRFAGFPRELFTFLEGLEADNSKSYWESHKDVWEESVQEPVQALMAELEPEYGPLRTFRPHRDTRFSKDKSPYKTWVGVTSSDRAVGGIGSFLRVEAAGIRLACGSMAMAPDQIERFRSAIVNAATGAEFDEIRSALAADDLEVGPGKMPTLKRTPTGYPKDHPREELLRWKGAVVVKEYDRAAWMHRPAVLETVREVWTGAAPLSDWIHANVGESDTPRRRPS